MQNLTEVLNATLLSNLSDLVSSTSTVSTSTTTTTTTEIPLTTSFPPSDHTTATSIAFISLVVFGVACALIAKIVISHKKKRAELIGSARWRISASRQSASSASSGGMGQNSSATYLPMGRGGNNRSLNNQRQPLNSLDHPTADRLDWERQFFDDSEATTPSRLIFR
ncbi:Mid2 domain-containing protein [Caenorhabditis elegans]|uniref:Mid2 domain-containing protein n=1 Tax=Caenorhabditis elegans TaxID=6239 RepID=H2KYI0_CAEEL|nr:Mid2 domain-containing protein [Caenorhabditis elegans]CCD63357.1 Mid2 domain-containing protein [Caenorhabditis elegans]|eukprot:NP_741438.1 Uncharacterized protein CELE_D2024.5 [Caenorhabditis elegans]